MYLTAKEAHDKLGSVAEQYLDQRNPQVLQHSFEHLCTIIEIGCIYKGVEHSTHKPLTIQIQLASNETTTVDIGTVTMVQHIYRLLTPSEI